MPDLFYVAKLKVKSTRVKESHKETLREKLLLN